MRYHIRNFGTGDRVLVDERWATVRGKNRGALLVRFDNDPGSFERVTLGRVARVQKVDGSWLLGSMTL